ncbi:MAG: hypothetical protein DI589_13805 [Shinella sp.]|jgi:hypothetical protein|nr:MAG: hypothetical protein DI589_13805 [Shinella sp.]
MSNDQLKQQARMTLVATMDKILTRRGKKTAVAKGSTFTASRTKPKLSDAIERHRKRHGGST